MMTKNIDGEIIWNEWMAIHTPHEKSWHVVDKSVASFENCSHVYSNIFCHRLFTPASMVTLTQILKSSRRSRRRGGRKLGEVTTGLLEALIFKSTSQHIQGQWSNDSQTHYWTNDITSTFKTCHLLIINLILTLIILLFTLNLRLEWDLKLQ